MDGITRPAERLAQVDAAIEAVLAGGQSYKLGSQSVTRADLSQLRALREELAAQAEREDGAGLLPRTWVARFGGR